MLKNFVKRNEGVTLVEILAAVAVPLILGHIKETEVEVCDINASELGKKYHHELVLEGKGHSDVAFSSFLLEHEDYVCPIDGKYHYVEGEVECSVHDEVEGTEDDEEVPFL